MGEKNWEENGFLGEVSRSGVPGTDSTKPVKRMNFFSWDLQLMFLVS